MFSGRVFVVATPAHPCSRFQLLVALRHLRDLGQLIHDGVHLGLGRLSSDSRRPSCPCTSDSSSASVSICPGDDRTVAEAGLHLPDETGPWPPWPRLAPADRTRSFCLIEGQQLVLEDVVGQPESASARCLFLSDSPAWDRQTRPSCGCAGGVFHRGRRRTIENCWAKFSSPVASSV